MRRAVAVSMAVLLAGLGTFLLVSYVRGAEDRALEGEELVTVWVVDTPIAAGTDASSLHAAIREESVPIKVAATDSVSSLDDLAGRVAAVDLVPGEQLIASRFVTAESYAARTRIDVPTDLLQVTLSLDPARAVGGQLLAGDHVAVVASFDQFSYDSIEPSEVEAALRDVDLDLIVTDLGIFQVVTNVAPGQETQANPEDGSTATGSIRPSGIKTPHSTHIIGHKVLITNIQVEEQPVTEPTADGRDLAPTGNLLITVAADPSTIEAIVFTAEHGTLWLAVEDPEAQEPETEIRTRGNIYE